MAKKPGKVVAKKKSIKAAKVSVAKAKVKSKSQPPSQAKLSNVWQLTRTAALTLWDNRKLFVGIIAVYGFLNIILAQGLSGGTDVSSLKHSLEQNSNGQFKALGAGLSIFGTLLGSTAGNSSTSAGAYELFLALLASLAIIWALRQVLSNKPASVRYAYYRSMYPLVPFILVLLVIAVQLIPLLIGSTIYVLLLNNGIAISILEKLAALLIYGLLAFWSLYMLSSSLFALYIVTLPDMMPMQALRSARQLVRSRRWTIFRKVLFLPLVLLVAGAVVMLPVIIWLTPLARWVFFIITLLGLAAIHAYMYTFYRELIDG